MTVKNVGTTPSTALVVTPTGAGITATGCAGTALAPNTTCTINVSVTPTVAGAISGSIDVGDAISTKKIPVTGTAVPPGQFSLSPNPLDLGPVLTGKTVSGTVTMTNLAPSGLTGIVFAVGGAGYALGTGTCTDALTVGQTCTIVVNYTAGATSGAAKGTLTVNQGGVTKQVAISATVQAPAKLVITPPAASLQTVVGTPSSPVTFYVANSGDVPSGIPAVTLTGANKDDFSFTSTCATALAGGASASCQVVVVYNPKAAPATNSAAVLTVSESAGPSTVSANLTGSAVLPSTLAITGASTDLGTVVVGATGTALTFTVTNNGGTASGALKVSAAPGQFVVSTDCDDKDLAPKGTCTFTAAFKPAATDAGVVQGNLKVVGASVTNPALLGVTGNAVPAAKLAIDPKSLDFAAQPAGLESTAQTLTISNVGGAPTGALKVENTGAQFKVKGDTCTGAVLTAAGATKTCTVIVTFTSTGATTVDATGSIVVSDTTGAAGSVSATLHGTGVEASSVVLAPTPATFAATVVGKTSAEFAFTVTNNTDPATAPDSGTMTFALSGDAAADFAIAKNNCTAPLLSVTSGSTAQTCSLTVTFTPSALGARNAYLTLTTSRGSVSRVTLTGTGVAVLSLIAYDASPNATPPVTGLDFGSKQLGKTGSTHTYLVVVRDTTAADHTTTVTVSLPTPALPDFVWPTSGVNPCTGKTLDLSSTATTQNGYSKVGSFWECAFTVQFAPKSAKGALSADLTASATGGGSDKLTLTGTATGPIVVGVGANFSKPAIINTPVAIGMTSSITLTISNQGAVAQTGLTFGISGTGSSDFQVIGTTCWGATAVPSHHAYADIPAVTLAPAPATGSTCTVTLGFAPQTEGKYSITFTATAANGAGAADDETDSVNVITTGATTFGTLTVTPNPAITQFGDVPEGSTTAAPVTFTVTNTGTLPAVGLTATGLTQFAILPSTGVAGACTLGTNTFTLAGNTPCTISIRPLPTTTVPSGTTKVVVNETLTVTSSFGGQTVAAQVPVRYYVTSSIVVKDTGAASTAIAYAFPAAGVDATQAHNFVVTNIGSTAATLVATVAAPYSVVGVPTGTFDPPACVYTASGLPAGASCTLVLQNLNTTGSSDAATLLTLQDGSKAGRATVSLTKSTLSASVVDLAANYLDTTPVISLGSVPADSTTASFVGGKATVWYQNTGGIPSAALSFKWGTGAAGTVDPEFIIDSDETSCVGKALQPGALCSMNIHFKYDSVNLPALGARTRVLTVMDGTHASATVTLTATATATASLRIEDPTDPVKTGFYMFAGSTLKDVASAVRTFRIVNSTGATQTFTLPALNHTDNDFVYAATQPATGACNIGSAQVLNTSTTACSFNVVFNPRANTAYYKHEAITITDLHGTGAGDDVSATIGLMGKVQQPVTLQLTPAGTTTFGTIGVGATAARSFTLTNVGDVPMTTDKLSLSTTLGVSTANAAFAVTADTCAATRLAAGASCVVTVTATGLAYNASAQTTTLVVSSGDYTAPAAVTASVLVKNAAALSVSPTVGTFGQTPVTGYRDIVFTVSNAANALTSGVVTASLSGKDAAQFTVLPSDCSATAGLDSTPCHVTVRFSPSALATDGNDLAAVLTVAGAAATVNLTGTPIAALTLSPAGPVNLSNGTALQSFTATLANTATATAALKTSLTGADFMIVSDGCYAQVLSIGGTSSCQITVKYTGTATPTLKSATLTVDGGSPAKKASAVVNATNIVANSH